MPCDTIQDISGIPQVLREEKVDQPAICLSKTIGAKERTVILIGETHVATRSEERAASRIIPYFGHIGCEGIFLRGFSEGKFYTRIMDHIEPFLTYLIFLGKRSKKYKGFLDTAYAYRDNKEKDVALLEDGWKPSMRMRLFLILFPLYLLVSIAEVLRGGATLAYHQDITGNLPNSYSQSSLFR